MRTLEPTFLDNQQHNASVYHIICLIENQAPFVDESLNNHASRTYLGQSSMDMHDVDALRRELKVELFAKCI